MKKTTLGNWGGFFVLACLGRFVLANLTTPFMRLHQVGLLPIFPYFFTIGSIQ
jgi:hypothetical protein